MREARRQRYTMVARAGAVADNRARIARAMLKFVLAQPYEEITLAAIARAAGVSHQTVLNHFASKEGVAAAAARLLAEETEKARAKARPGDLPGAIRVLVGEYERFGDANARWAMSSELLGSLAPLLDEARAGHQEWLIRIFGGMLPAVPAARRRALVALHAATDVYTWKLLRRDLRLSRRDTEAGMADLVEGVLLVHGRRQVRRPVSRGAGGET
jgi:AcrR family transcriptional regulator